MISSVFAYAFAMAGMQAADTTRTQREAFNTCLRTYVQRSADSHMTMDAFNAAFPQQCQPQETAYRNAVVQREAAAHSTAEEAQQSANDEIEESRTNFHDRFEMMTVPAPHG